MNVCPVDPLSTRMSLSVCETNWQVSASTGDRTLQQPGAVLKNPRDTTSGGMLSPNPLVQHRYNCFAVNFERKAEVSSRLAQHRMYEQAVS